MFSQVNKKLFLLLGCILIAAALFRAWPETEPEAYRMTAVEPEVARQVVAFVDAAHRFYREGKPNREKRMLRESVRLGDENLIRDFFAVFASIDAPDFTQAVVTSPASRPDTYRVDFPDRTGQVAVVAEYLDGGLGLVECRRL